MTTDPNKTKVEAYAGSQSKVLTTGNPAGQLIELPPAPGSKLFAWSTKERLAMDLELRARIVGAPPAFFPEVRWSSELGHGRVSYSDPAPSVSGGLGGAIAIADEILPARGMVWRLSAKELRINFRNFTVGLLPPLSIKLLVSVQPAQGALPFVRRQQQISIPAAGSSSLNRFPAEASSWFLRSAFSGKALVGYTVTYVSIANASIITVAPPVAMFEDPIPVTAAGFFITDAGGGATTAMASYVA